MILLHKKLLKRELKIDYLEYILFLILKKIVDNHKTRITKQKKKKKKTRL